MEISNQSKSRAGGHQWRARNAERVALNPGIQPIQLVISAFSGYRDVFHMMLGELNRFADSDTPLEIIVLADSPLFVREAADALPMKPHLRLRWIAQYDENEPFWKQIQTLRGAPLQREFIFLQDDFVLFKSPDWAQVSELTRNIRSTPHHFIRLVPSGVEHPLPKYEQLQDLRFVRVDRQSSYHHSWQATVWKRNFFFLLNATARPRSIRDENKARYKRIMRLLGMKGLASTDILFPYIQTAVRGGKWDYGAKVGGHLLPELLMKYGIKPTNRGIRTGK